MAEHDDALMEKYVEGQPITPLEIQGALRRATLSQAVVPVLCGSAFKNKGIQPLLDAIVDYLPAPTDVPPITGLNPQGQVEPRPADEKGPFTALAFKIMSDPYVGHLTFLRVYSGRVISGGTVINVNKGKKEKIGRLLKMHANQREDIKEIQAGDIVAVVGLKNTTTGDSLCAPEAPAPVGIASGSYPGHLHCRGTSDQGRYGQIGPLPAADRGRRPFLPGAYR